MTVDVAVIPSLQAENRELRQRIAELETQAARTQEREHQLQMFAALIEHAIDGVTLTDLQGRLLYANAAMLQMGGYTSLADLQGRDLVAFFVAEERERIHDEIIPHLLEHGSWQGHLWVLRADGSCFLAQNASFVLTDAAGQPQALAGFTRDITRQYEAEQQIERQNADLRMFQALVEHAPDSIGVIGLDQTIRYANPAFHRSTGYDNGVSPLGKPADDFYAEAPEHLVAMRDTVQRNGFWRGILTYRRRDSSTFQGQATIFTICDDAGQPQAIAGIAHDITERLRIERELKESQAMLQAILDNSPAPISVRDLQGRYLVVNQRGLELLGLRPEQIIGKTDTDIFPPESAVAGQRKMAQVLATGLPQSFEDTFLLETGLRTFIEHVFALYDAQGRLSAVGSIFSDITPRKQAEDLLRRSNDELEQRVQERTIELTRANSALQEEILEHRQTERELRTSKMRYRAISELVSDLAYTMRVEPDGTLAIEWTNDSLVRITGYTLEEINALGGWATVIHPDDRSFVARNEETLRCGRTVVNEYRIIARNGEVRWLRSHMRPVWDMSVGKIVRIYGATQDITAEKEAEERNYRQLQRLAALRQVDMAIISHLDLEIVLTILLEHITHQLHVDAAMVLLRRSEPTATSAAALERLEYVAGKGFRSVQAPDQPLCLGPDCPGRRLLERRPVQFFDLRDVKRDSGCTRIAWLEEEGFIAYYGVPLIARGEVLGVLELFNRSPHSHDQEWLDFLDTLAGQMAIAIQDARLMDGLQRAHDDLTLAYDATIEGWARALELRDADTEGHTRRVTELTLALAREMGFGADELVHIRRGALLHDIGKLAIPDSILLKAGPLTEEEWAIMRQHTIYAYRLLAPIPFLRPALDIPYCHHERWDGAGYPNGLADEAIPLAARIFAVVDVWDALSSDRPYRPGWPRERVCAYIREQAGAQFDAQVVEVFLRLQEQA